MALRDTLRRPRTWAIGIPVLILLAVVVGPFVYLNFIKADAPERLAFEPVTTTTAAPEDTSDPSTTADSAGDDAMSGSWIVGPGSVAGYRVQEILFGQSSEAAGRTESVTGTIAIDGTVLASGEFTVDLTTVASDDNRRDNQFHGRIMNTGTFPTATFALGEPVDFGTVPGDLEQITVPVTGQLTMHGVTNEIAVDLLARRNGAGIEVNGTIPIAFSDYDINNPSGGPAQVGDDGEIELLLLLTRG